MKKADRERIRMMFGGRCAYCGCELGERWHADHVEPLVRYPATGHIGDKMKIMYPERNRKDNLFPACIPCNIAKHSNGLDGWRRLLEEACGLLARGSATYRSAVRFGLVQEMRSPVVFHFERIAAPAATPTDGGEGYE